MKQKHNTFKRIFHRICEELKATYDVAQVISWKASIGPQALPARMGNGSQTS